MKYCKDELKILPKRLMVFSQEQLHANAKPNIKQNTNIDDRAFINESLCEREIEEKEIITIDDLFPQKKEKNEFIKFAFNKLARGENINKYKSIKEKQNYLENKSKYLLYRRVAQFFIEKASTIIDTVDDSLGEIKALVIGYTTYVINGDTNKDNNDKVNAFNKIYADLIIKLSRIGYQNSDKNDLKIFSIAYTEDSKKYLTRINEAIESLAYFTETVKNETCYIDYKSASNEVNTTVWMQDEIIPVVLRNLPDRNDINVLYSNPLSCDVESNQHLSEADIISLLDTKTYLPQVELPSSLIGGNILFVGNKILIGYNNLVLCDTELNSNPTFIDETKFREKLKELFGKKKEIIFIGSKEGFAEKGNKHAWLRTGMNYQPLHHLDLFISAAGRSPDDTYRLVIGEPVIHMKDESHLFDDDGLLEKTRKELDRIAAQLVYEHKFDVTRIPMPITWVDLINNTNERKRIWAFASYNNCLVQYLGNKHEKNWVLLPRYSGSFTNENARCADENGKLLSDENGAFYKGGDWSELKKYENEVEKKWTKLGFKPMFFTNYLPLLIFKGSLRCTVKVIKREKLVIS